MRLQSAAVAAALASAALPAVPFPASAQEHASYTFYRNGVAVGRHVVETSGSGPRLNVNIRTQVAVQLADRITLFRFAHRASESWEGDRLVAMDTQTDDNGKQFRVIVKRTASSLVVHATVPDVEQASVGDRMLGLAPSNNERLVEQVVPAGILPTSWSHPSVLKQNRLLNSQSGAVGPVAIQQLGNEVVQTGLGQIPSTRYRVSGMATLDIWYDARNRWMKSTFHARDGSSIEVIRDR